MMKALIKFVYLISLIYSPLWFIVIFIQLGPRFPFLGLRNDEESKVQVGGWVGLCPKKLIYLV